MSDFEGNEKKTGYSFSDFMEDEIRDSAFKVSIRPHRMVPHLFLIVSPVIFYIFFFEFFRLLDEAGLSHLSGSVILVLFIVLLFGIYIFLYNCGKEVVVSGRGIVVRKFFVINESFSVDDVIECTVITGLVTSGRLHEHYNKAVIVYGDGKRITLEDTLFKGWSRLVRYMEMNGKLVTVDGRGMVSKKLDEMLRR
ncbi:MAG: hypothetical protein J5696_03395 [Lachnospiraceae bacterium]|nr:hypothetical protein [Lachnospiraceae bacterium]